MVARYDRTLARQVLEGFAQRAMSDRIGLDDRGSMFRDNSIFQAAAIVDPARAVAMLQSLPESTGSSSARMLVPQGGEHWDAVERSLIHHWRLDSEDDY
jgi:hypothetical protein